MTTDGRIPADDEALMVRLLEQARHHARPPISNYRVGAVARGSSGSLYVGANIELPDNALNQTVHAEQSAVANAFANRERGITAIAVTAAPCGHCRQFLNEITDGGAIRIIVNEEVRLLAELLPASFGPKDLGMPDGMFSGSPAPLRLLFGSDDALARLALDAASRAYAPYTKALSGCAIETKSGRTFSGSYLENAAFNPSLSPLQSALVTLFLAEEDPAAITRVALVEIEGAPVTQTPATEVVLRAIAPAARLDRFAAQRR